MSNQSEIDQEFTKFKASESFALCVNILGTHNSEEAVEIALHAAFTEGMNAAFDRLTSNDEEQ